MATIVHLLAQDVKNSKERGAWERENLLLELENRLLKFERTLPPAGGEGEKTPGRRSAKRPTKKAR